MQLLRLLPLFPFAWTWAPCICGYLRRCALWSWSVCILLSLSASLQLRCYFYLSAVCRPRIFIRQSRNSSMCFDVIHTMNSNCWPYRHSFLSRFMLIIEWLRFCLMLSQINFNLALHRQNLSSSPTDTVARKRTVFWLLISALEGLKSRKLNRSYTLLYMNSWNHPSRLTSLSLLHSKRDACLGPVYPTGEASRSVCRNLSRCWAFRHWVGLDFLWSDLSSFVNNWRLWTSLAGLLSGVHLLHIPPPQHIHAPPQ